jgi:rhamnosyl/mannosyltransferase
MRILHLGKYFHPFQGGMENFVQDLSEQQLEAGHEVRVLVHDHESGRPSTQVEYHGIQATRARTLFRLLFTPLSPAWPGQLRKLIGTFKPQLIHVHVPNPHAFLLPLMGAARDIPLVVHWHSDILTEQTSWLLRTVYSLLQPLENRLLERAAAIIATSPNYLATSPVLKRWQHKTHVIPLGLTRKLPQANPAVISLWHTGDFRVLSIGRLTYYKGHEFLIAAAAGLPRTTTLIVGTGDQRAALESSIRARGAQDAIRLTGFLDEASLFALLASCDVLVLPSIERTEAFGLVLLEAMRAGKPCIVSDVAGSGMSWVVQNEVTGLVVKAADPGSLQEALTRLRDNPALRTAMGRAGQQRFHEVFTSEKVASLVDKLYKALFPG